MVDRIVVERGTSAVEIDDELLGTAPLLDLPQGAVANPDGTVTLALEFPVTVRTRVAGTEAVHQESITELVLHRMTGLDMRKIIGQRKAMSQVALARSTRLPPARMALISARMDASDLNAAGAVVAELGGFNAEGMPERAVEQDGVITLTLLFPCEPEGAEPRHELVFNRLRGDDLQAIQQAREALPAALARSTKMIPKEADAVFDAMDAADIMDANRVIDFLSGSGRRTGR